jgi:hypothetical protein
MFCQLKIWLSCNNLLTFIHVLPIGLRILKETKSCNNLLLIQYVPLALHFWTHTIVFQQLSELIMFLLQLLSELTCFFYENMEWTLVSFFYQNCVEVGLRLGFVAFRVSFLRLQVGWQGCWWYSSRSENYHRSVLIWSNCFSCVGCVVGAVFHPLLDVSYTHFWIHVHFCFEVDETGFGGCVRINFSLSACVSFMLEQSVSAHFVSESLFLLQCIQTIMRGLERTNFLATIVLLCYHLNLSSQVCIWYCTYILKTPRSLQLWVLHQQRVLGASDADNEKLASVKRILNLCTIQCYWRRWAWDTGCSRSSREIGNT